MDLLKNIKPDAKSVENIYDRYILNVSMWYRHGHLLCNSTCEKWKQQLAWNSMKASGFPLFTAAPQRLFFGQNKKNPFYIFGNWLLTHENIVLCASLTTFSLWFLLQALP